MNTKYTVSSESKTLFKGILEDIITKKYMDKLKDHHFETYQHSIRTGIISLDLGVKNNFPKEDLMILGYGGLLHDIGKLNTPTNLLSKEGKLTGEEFKIVKNHSRDGFNILKDYNNEGVKKIVVGHHEVNIKNCYPRNINNSFKERFENRRNFDEKIKLLTEIVAIADVYDALASKRSYKGGFKFEDIQDIMTSGDYNWDNKSLDTIFSQ